MLAIATPSLLVSLTQVRYRLLISHFFMYPFLPQQELISMRYKRKKQQ